MFLGISLDGTTNIIAQRVILGTNNAAATIKDRITHKTVVLLQLGCDFMTQYVHPIGPTNKPNIIPDKSSVNGEYNRISPLWKWLFWPYIKYCPSQLKSKAIFHSINIPVIYPPTTTNPVSLSWFLLFLALLIRVPEIVRAPTVIDRPKLDK